MSTFGKKSLSWWNYNTNGDKLISQQFRNTDSDLQLNILEKWYPIGTKVQKWNWLLQKYNGDEWTIIRYELSNNVYSIILVNKDQYNDSRIPTLLKPIKEELNKILREIKLNKIIDG